MKPAAGRACAQRHGAKRGKVEREPGRMVDVEHIDVGWFAAGEADARGPRPRFDDARVARSVDADAATKAENFPGAVRQQCPTASGIWQGDVDHGLALDEYRMIGS